MQNFYFTMGSQQESLIQNMMWKGNAVDKGTQEQWIEPILDKERG